MFSGALAFFLKKFHGCNTTRGLRGAQFVATFMIIPNRGLEEKETEVTVVDENEVEGSDKENEQEEQTEPVNVVEQTDEWGGNL